MKAKGMILSAIIMLMCWSGAWAEDKVNLFEGDSLNFNIENIFDKTWCEVDEETGAKLRTELFFGKDSLVLCCIMAENPKESAPKWSLCSYAISKDNIDIAQMASYEIVKLADDSLVLLNKEATGKKQRTFVALNFVNKNSGDVNNLTTLDLLTAKQWQDPNPPNFRTKWHRWYFAENKWTLVDFEYNKQKQKWDVVTEVRDYYLADWVDHNFSRGQLSKKRENGKYINYYKEYKVTGMRNKAATKIENSRSAKIRSLSYKINHLSKNSLMVENVPIYYDEVGPGGQMLNTHKCFMICY